MRIPEAGPLGETFFEARALATTAALLLNSPGGGCVESEVTEADHRLGLFVLLVFAVAVLGIGASTFPR